MKKPTYVNSNNLTYTRRMGDYELWQTLGVTRYDNARKCVECGCQSFRRNKDGECFECVVKENVGTVEHVDDGKDCLSFDADMRAAIATLPPRRRLEDRAVEYMPRAYTTDIQQGMCYLREC